MKTLQEIPDLPQEIKDCFPPCESINPANNRYIAQPRFIGYPDNHLIEWSWTFERVDNAGNKWLVRQYSPVSHVQGTKLCGSFDVIYCRLVS